MWHKAEWMIHFFNSLLIYSFVFILSSFLPSLPPSLSLSLHVSLTLIHTPTYAQIAQSVGAKEYTDSIASPVDWGCRIHWVHLCKEIRPTYPTSVLDITENNLPGKFPGMLELWGMWSICSLPSLPSPFWPEVVTPDRALSISQIKLSCVLMLNWIVWNRTDLDIETVLR